MTSGNALSRVGARLEALERRFGGFQSRFDRSLAQSVSDWDNAVSGVKTEMSQKLARSDEFWKRNSKALRERIADGEASLLKSLSELQGCMKDATTALTSNLDTAVSSCRRDLEGLVQQAQEALVDVQNRQTYLSKRLASLERVWTGPGGAASSAINAPARPRVGSGSHSRSVSRERTGTLIGQLTAFDNRGIPTGPAGQRLVQELAQALHDFGDDVSRATES